MISDFRFRKRERTDKYRDYTEQLHDSLSECHKQHKFKR